MRVSVRARLRLRGCGQAPELGVGSRARLLGEGEAEGERGA